MNEPERNPAGEGVLAMFLETLKKVARRIQGTQNNRDWRKRRENTTFTETAQSLARKVEGCEETGEGQSQEESQVNYSEEFEAAEAFIKMLEDRTESLFRPRMDFFVYDEHADVPTEGETYPLDLVVSGLREALEAQRQKLALLGLLGEVREMLKGDSL